VSLKITRQGQMIAAREESKTAIFAGYTLQVFRRPLLDVWFSIRGPQGGVHGQFQMHPDELKEFAEALLELATSTPVKR